MLSEAQILDRLRKICTALPGVAEGTTFGHPTFRVNGKMFAVLEEYKGELGIWVKVEKELQGIFLDDSRFFRTPYIGKHGWVTLKVYAARLILTEVKGLVRGSHRLVAAPGPKPKKQTARKQSFSARKKTIC
jgi:predicted DNA-binding protein (MmcQ/YjbR family)